MAQIHPNKARGKVTNYNTPSYRARLLIYSPVLSWCKFCKFEMFDSYGSFISITSVINCTLRIVPTPGSRRLTSNMKIEEQMLRWAPTSLTVSYVRLQMRYMQLWSLYTTSIEFWLKSISSVSRSFIAGYGGLTKSWSIRSYRSLSFLFLSYSSILFYRMRWMTAFSSS